MVWDGTNRTTQDLNKKLLKKKWLEWWASRAQLGGSDAKSKVPRLETLVRSGNSNFFFGGWVGALHRGPLAFRATAAGSRRPDPAGRLVLLPVGPSPASD